MRQPTMIAAADGSVTFYCKDHNAHLPLSDFHPSDVRNGQRLCKACRRARRRAGDRKRILLQTFKQTAKRRGVGGNVHLWELDDVAKLLEPFSDEELKDRCLAPNDPNATEYTPATCKVVLRSEAPRRRRKPRKKP